MEDYKNKKLIKPQTLKGFRDFLPEDELKRLFLIEKIRKVCEVLGFDPIETPALEYANVLVGKYGEDADMLLYLFKDRGRRLIGLRYDQTVPTSRFVAQYSTLPLPFKRYQIQPVWRQENPQKGRFREFLQVDADIFGISSTMADAEIVFLIYNIYNKLGFKKFIIKLNNRQTLFDIISSANIDEELRLPILRSLDKMEKIGEEGVRRELLSKKVQKEKIKKIFEIIRTLVKPKDKLKEVFDIAISLGVPNEFLRFESTLVRGLDYYTGTIFEVLIPDYTAGSVLGGGRYDKLVEQFSGKDIPGVGFGLGFDRTLEAMEQFNLLPKRKTVTKALVTVFSPDLLKESIITASFLRQKKINTELYPDIDIKLDKQLKYADLKGIPYVLIIGPDEVKANKITLKNMQTKEQKFLTKEELVQIVIASEAKQSHSL